MTDAGRRREPGLGPLSLGLRRSAGTRRPFRAGGRRRDPRPEAGAAGPGPGELVSPAPAAPSRLSWASCLPRGNTTVSTTRRVAGTPESQVSLRQGWASALTLRPFPRAPSALPARTQSAPRCVPTGENLMDTSCCGDETLLFTGQSALGPTGCGCWSLSAQRSASLRLHSAEQRQVGWIKASFLRGKRRT